MNYFHSRIAVISLFSVLLLISNSIQAATKAKITLKQGTYKLGNIKPAYGPKLPINGPVIRVYAESGTKYSHVANKHKKLKFLTNYTAFCESATKKKLTGLSVQIAGETSSGSKKGHSFQTGYAALEVSYNKFPDFKPAQWCNDHLTTLSLEKKKSKKSLVKKGFTLYIPDLVKAHGKAFCAGAKSKIGSDNAKLGVWISCEANPNVDRPSSSSKPTQPKPNVGKTKKIFKSATLKADKIKLSGKSPQRLKLTATLVTSGKGTIKAQIIGNHGLKSPVREFKFSKAGSKKMNWTHYLRSEDMIKTLVGNAGDNSQGIQGWATLKVWYEVKNNKARATKTYTSPKIKYTVNFDSSTKKPVRLKIK